MEQALMRIGEIAAFFGISLKAVRLYEKKGIIKPAVVDPQTGYRYYTAGQVQLLDSLLALKRLGFSLLEIKTLLANDLRADLFMEALAHKKAAWQDAVAAAELKMEEIEKITRHLATAEPAAPLHDMTEDERAWALAKLIAVENLDAQNTLASVLWL